MPLKVFWCQLIFSLQVRFIFRLAYRRSSGHHCEQSTISQGTLIGEGGSWNAECIGASNPQCPSSTAVASTYYHCTDFSVSEDWSMGENSFNYTFPSSDNEWSVRYVLFM